jgi:hypothetical protein
MIKPHKAQNPGLTTSPVVLGSDIQTLLDATSSFQLNSNHEPAIKGVNCLTSKDRLRSPAKK